MKLAKLNDVPLGHWELVAVRAIDGDTIEATIHLGFEFSPSGESG